jgi:hypothetical protein
VGKWERKVAIVTEALRDMCGQTVALVSCKRPAMLSLLTGSLGRPHTVGCASAMLGRGRFGLAERRKRTKRERDGACRHIARTSSYRHGTALLPFVHVVETDDLREPGSLAAC